MFDPVPDDAKPFYVSDSFTIKLEGGLTAPYTQLHYPGVANQTGVIPPNSRVKIYILSCSVVSLPITTDQQQGINTDVMVGIYSVGDMGRFVQVAKFSEPYGSATNGQVINQVTKLSNNTPRAWRNFGAKTPLVMEAFTPSSGIFQVGAAFQFNFGIKPILVQYEYHLHGAWKVVP